jgi:hypothetical protein
VRKREEERMKERERRIEKGIKAESCGTFHSFAFYNSS